MAEPEDQQVAHALSDSTAASQSVSAAIDRLLLIQDAAARGEVGAASRQKSQLLKIGKIISAMPNTEYPRIVNDATIYVLSGGDPNIAGRVAAIEGPPSVHLKLLRASIHFMRGERKEAGVLISGIESTRLSPRMAGRVALAQALVSTGSNRQALFAIAASAMPGTLVEESALRRSALYFADARDEPGFWRRIDRYTRRFPSSSYAPAFWGEVTAILASWTKKGPSPNLRRLDYVLAMLPQVHRRKIYLELARRSAAIGEPSLTGFAGRRLRRLAVAGGLEDRLGLFYTALYQIVSAEGDSALLSLRGIEPDTLDPQERALLKAALAVGQQIERPPFMPSRISFDEAEKTALVVRGEQLLSQSYELISELN
jgi:chemotaxis protein MotC